MIWPRTVQERRGIMEKIINIKDAILNSPAAAGYQSTAIITFEAVIIA